MSSFQRTGAALICLLLAATAAAQEEPSDAITATRLKEHLEFLSSDALEGRGPGTPGAALARDYIISQLKAFGATPGNGDSWLQPVPLRRIENSRPFAKILRPDGSEWVMKYGEEMVGENRRGPGRHKASGELVFVGHGVQAPEYGWDDYKGLDCKGKILVMLVGDPPTEDASLFGGKAMTYYGRWTYKYDKARDMGAAGCLVVHKTPWAGYPWGVVYNSWNGVHMDTRDPNPDRQTAFEGWVPWKVAEKLVAATGKTLDQLAAEARTRDFEPYALDLKFESEIVTDNTDFEDENIAAVMKGSDPERADEHVIFSAHYDHLGRNEKVPTEDKIYNGAVDNASGCAALLTIAEAFGRMKGAHGRSVMFLFVCSEEQGLLGSRWYSQQPIIAPKKTVANVNIDGINVHEVTRDLQIVGSGQSDLDGLLTEELEKLERIAMPDAESEKGYYYRSDHFNFARIGIPALYTKTGDVVVGRPQGWLRKIKDVWRVEDYHKVSDEFDPNWSCEGGANDALVLFNVARRLLAGDRWPQWNATSEFRAVRERSLAGGR